MKSFSLPILLFGIVSTSTACAHERIHDVRAARDITRDELLRHLDTTDVLVVGEKHSTESIQAAEAKLFSEFAALKSDGMTFAWEFWNWTDQPKLESAYEKFLRRTTDGPGFLREMFGESKSEAPYLPLVEAVRSSSAKVLATNLSRAEKAPVVKEGIGALDPKHLPPGFALGGDAYRERFMEATGGHGDPKKLENYFIAQCLVDDVIALHLQRDRSTQAAFLVVGSFHSRYFDGVWKRLEVRERGGRRTLIEIVDPEDESDWETVLRHPKYGPSADFVVFTR